MIIGVVRLKHLYLLSKAILDNPGRGRAFSYQAFNYCIRINLLSHVLLDFWLFCILSICLTDSCHKYNFFSTIRSKYFGGVLLLL